jgi:DNA invertase Pin-like site-specific DNA recombinase
METNTTKTFGYARVSTDAQTNDRQLDALTASGISVDEIFTDKISGVRQSRPGLDALLKVARAGDTITVKSLDRLGRTSLHVMQTIAELSERDILVRSLSEAENKSGATGTLMRGLMILIAEWERSMNAERVAEARASKALRVEAGEQVAGRPRTALSPSKVAEVKKWKAKGRGASEIATLTGMSRASVYRALAEL